MRLLRLVGCCFMLLISACQSVSYKYNAPETAAGKQCTVQCASLRETCRSNENQRVQAEKRFCERRSETTYLVCVDRAKDNKDQQKECDNKREQCSSHQSYVNCFEEYNECYSNCGGTVQKVIEK